MRDEEDAGYEWDDTIFSWADDQPYAENHKVRRCLSFSDHDVEGDDDVGGFVSSDTSEEEEEEEEEENHTVSLDKDQLDFLAGIEPACSSFLAPNGAIDDDNIDNLVELEAMALGSLFQTARMSDG